MNELKSFIIAKNYCDRPTNTPKIKFQNSNSIVVSVGKSINTPSRPYRACSGTHINLFNRKIITAIFHRLITEENYIN